MNSLRIQMLSTTLLLAPRFAARQSSATCGFTDSVGYLSAKVQAMLARNALPRRARDSQLSR